MTGLFIFGLPGEPVSSIRESMVYFRSPECPLDAINVHALQISSLRGNSKIDKSPNKFGYVRTDEYEWTRFDDWKTDEMDAKTARELAEEFKKTANYGSLYQGMSGFVLLSAYGFMTEQYTKSTRLVVGVMEMEKQCKAHRNAYFDQLLNWDGEYVAPTGERLSRVVSPKPPTVSKSATK